VAEDIEFVEYLKLQDNLDMCSKTELLDDLRRSGARVSARQLTTYVTEGLVPKSARVGSRSGVYPRVILDLVYWIEQSRRRGLSIEAIKQLVPLWRFVRAGLKRREVDLGEFEALAQEVVSLEEAAFAVPSLFVACLPCPVHDTNGQEALLETKFVLKEGTRVKHSAKEPMTLGFTITDAKDNRCRLASTRIAIPLADEHESPSTVSLTVSLPHDDAPTDATDLSGRASGNQRKRSRERS
jgi:DNA-binding transcriptional MerR regulator